MEAKCSKNYFTIFLERKVRALEKQVDLAQ